jgi:diguanylate cyclase (GGDEF)-like protein
MWVVGIAPILQELKRIEVRKGTEFEAFSLLALGENFSSVASEMDGTIGQIGRWASILDSARSPLVAMEGADQIVCYVNAAFCQLARRSSEEIVGKSFSQLVPLGDECLLQLGQVFLSGKVASHAKAIHATPNTLYWSYEIWPIWGEECDEGNPVGVILLVTETAPFHERVSVMNEALLVSAVRQHELIDEAETLRAKLEAEIAQRQQAEAAIEQVAFYDPPTDLPNRRLLMDRLHKAVSVCSRNAHHGAILFIDLDRFKTLNDTQGHHVGDLLLQEVARRLTASVRACDTVGRLGGDEFVVMVQELSENENHAKRQAELVAAKVLNALNEPYVLATHKHRGTGSVGVTVFGGGSESVAELMKRADLALYRAKEDGGGRIRFFESQMQFALAERATLEADLLRGLQEGQFLLHYQPQVGSKGQLIGAEALLRWQHPTRGLLLPNDFISVAEESGLIDPIGKWVMREACLQLASWSMKPAAADWTLSINISAREFRQPDFVPHLIKLVDEIGTDPGKLILELTERVTFGPLEEVFPKMIELKARGFCFALDDFGVGFSSLAYLKDLPLDQLKIDKSFVGALPTQNTSSAIVGAIIALGQSLGLAVIAEGVETREQLEALAERGCIAYQGFLFGRPGAEEELWFCGSGFRQNTDQTVH